MKIKLGEAIFDALKITGLHANPWEWRPEEELHASYNMIDENGLHCVLFEFMSRVELWYMENGAVVKAELPIEFMTKEELTN